MRKKFLRWVSILIMSLIGTIIIVPCSTPAEEVADGKIASVNGTVITNVEFEREMMAAYQQVMSTGRTIDQSQLPELRNRVLESLIGQELLFQQSSKKGIKIEDKLVNEQIDKMKQGFPDDNAFKAALEKSMISEDELKSDLRKKMTVQSYIDKEFFESTKIPDKEVKSFYDSHPESFQKPEQIRARHILIKVDQTADQAIKDKAREKITGILDRLKKGENFAELAREASECPSATDGGDLGLFGRGAMVPPFEKAAFDLPLNEVSDIVETEYGYHLIKVEEKNPASVVEYEEVKEKLQGYLTQLKVREKVKAHVDNLVEKAKIERHLE